MAVEGVDRAGKTTLTASLAAELAARGWRVGLHKEPSRGAVGAVFRQLSQAVGPSPLCFALLSAADRHERQAALVGLLAANEVVLADRYYLSGLAYHAADGIDPDFYASLNTGVLRPEVYLFLQVSPRVAARRGGPPAGRWEAEGIAARLPVLYDHCLRLAAAESSSLVVRLDADAAAERVLAAGVEAVEALLTRRPSTPDDGHTPEGAPHR